MKKHSITMTGLLSLVLIPALAVPTFAAQMKAPEMNNTVVDTAADPAATASDKKAMDKVTANEDKGALTAEAPFVLDGMAYLKDKDLLKGVTTEANQPMTRLDVVKIIANYEKAAYDKDNKFSDVNEDAMVAVNWAAMNNIVKGYEDGTFKGSDTLTREQFAVLMHRYLFGYKAFKPASLGGLKDKEVKDIKAVSPWAQESATLMLEAGFMHVDDQGMFMPQAALTLSEAADVLAESFHLFDPVDAKAPQKAVAPKVEAKSDVKETDKGDVKKDMPVDAPADKKVETPTEAK
ncbi:S-layer homology domain-containing protein [Peptoniphilus equinus]|uniref:S-layer homology domain-containing protein n=1 Tax=Peptoniphilus equinus TaxID=3016343 RepID=A0ABY7QSN8_9FIRM|nr:S-layer homology domain-containing protein [Peptoniphilus equinus]WBW49821.1 S-layer homology domain-containing protein [Peptoniphilus equinus]